MVAVATMAVELDTRPDRTARRGGGRRRRRTWLIRLLIGLVLLLTIIAGGMLGILAVTPSGATAPARVRALLASHSAPSDGGQVPAKVGVALLAVEDSRYRTDWAIDAQGTIRAMWGVMTANPNEGGATIEVQLAKLLYTPRRSDPVALTEQVAVAIKLDHDFSKTRILAMYLDAAYFGDGAYGVTQAARHYFGVDPDQLNWGQATLLAGLVQAPSRYDPHGHLGEALLRRKRVLDRLVAVGTFTRVQADSVAAEPLNPVVPFSG